MSLAPDRVHTGDCLELLPQLTPASVDLAFGRFGLERLVATIDPDHEASRRVAEKIGMHVEKETVLDDGFACVVYATQRG